jgi:hypothetical protein
MDKTRIAAYKRFFEVTTLSFTVVGALSNANSDEFIELAILHKFALWELNREFPNSTVVDSVIRRSIEITSKLARK